MGEWDNYCGEIGEVCKDLETQAARIAELEKMAEARKLANRLLEQERNELEAERDRLRETLQDEHITSNARREKIIVLKAERDRLREALAEAVEKYGKPGGPWNIPGESGSWIAKAREALEGAEK